MSRMLKSRILSVFCACGFVLILPGCALFGPRHAPPKPDASFMTSDSDRKADAKSDRHGFPALPGKKIWQELTTFDPYGPGLTGQTGAIGQEVARTTDNAGRGVSLSGKGRDVERNLGYSPGPF